MHNQVFNHETLLVAYRKLILIRKSEEWIQKEYFKDEMKTPVHLGIGGEAISVGVQSILPQKTKFFGTYRNHSIFLALTENTDSFFAELYGKVTGCGKGKAGSMHLSAPEQGLIATSAVVASTIPVAAGAAFSNQYQGNSDPVCVFFGDGAMEEGVFWETLNFASLKKLNLLFVCEDNELAIHTHSSQRQSFLDLEKAISGFRCPFGTGDGSDVVTVMTETSQIFDEMRKKPGPAFLHFKYHRFLEHVGPLEDYKFGYRAKPENMDEKFDPILKCRRELLRRDIPVSEIEKIDLNVDLQIQASIRRAQEAPFPSHTELKTDVYFKPGSPLNEGA